jgi:hypothetical protein
VIDEGTLAVNLLGFRLKSFAFERTADVGGVPYALFHRTETESESKLRPRLLSLWLVVPQEWVAYDEASDSLRIAADGLPPGPPATGTALETAAESEQFTEQGVEWRRQALGALELLYVPDARAGPLLSPAGRRALGLGGAA